MKRKIAQTINAVILMAVEREREREREREKYLVTIIHTIT